MKRLIHGLGSIIRSLSTGIVAVTVIGLAVAYGNYNATVPGSGTAFGSIVVSTVHYAQQLICDQTTVVQCAGVTANNELKVIGTGVAEAATASGTTWSPVGCEGRTSEKTAVTNGQLVRCVADLVGKMIVLPYANPENFVSGAITSAMTGTTSTSLVAAPAAGLRNYITECTFSNSHATVGTDIILQDGSGGTTLWVVPAAAVFGGAHIVFPTPLRQPTTATALYAANVTTGANTKAACGGYKGA